MAKSHTVRLKRVYEDPAPSDGQRILVDRVWPRGLSKDRAELDDWCKRVAPSTELRRWYGHDPEKFEEFADRYRAELTGGEPATALDELRSRARKGPVTLLTASRDSAISQAAVLRDLLNRRQSS